MSTAVAHTPTSPAHPTATEAAPSLRPYVAATARSLRTIARMPSLLISPLSMSLFFMAIYAGQLSDVGPSYLGGTSFATFILPLILVTGAVTGAATAGELLVRDMTSGYLDRLSLAHGRATPFVIAPLIACQAVQALQVLLTIAAAYAIGFRITDVAGTFALIGLALVVGLAVALISAACALRFGTSSAIGSVTMVFFGLSFFTGVLAPTDQLSGWMHAVAIANPLTYVIDTMRSFVDPGTTSHPAITAATLTVLGVAGLVACMSGLKRRTMTR
jgi:ABC-2 type transport system permease protein